MRGSCHSRWRSACSVTMILRSSMTCRCKGVAHIGRPAIQRYLWIVFSGETLPTPTRSSCEGCLARHHRPLEDCYCCHDKRQAGLTIWTATVAAVLEAEERY